MADIKLIDADALIKRIYEDGKKSNNPSLMMLVGFVTGYVNKQQEAIVRCIDCKWRTWGDADAEMVWCKLLGRANDLNWFCADGEMKGKDDG